MGKALIFVFGLIILTEIFKKVAEWFEKTKDINIIPASFIEMPFVVVFMVTCGSEYTNEIIWMWVSVAVVVAITIFNLIKYGIKDGALVSLAQLFFSISAAFLFVCIIVSRSSKKKNTQYKRKR